jgi:hypothetical protein
MCHLQNSVRGCQAKRLLAMPSEGEGLFPRRSRLCSAAISLRYTATAQHASRGWDISKKQYKAARSPLGPPVHRGRPIRVGTIIFQRRRAGGAGLAGDIRRR